MPSEKYGTEETYSTRGTDVQKPSLKNETFDDKGNDEKIPTPSHRHAAPSAPWPWINIHDDLDRCTRAYHVHPPDETDWTGYPQSLFPNWTEDQVYRSKIAQMITRNTKCIIHCLDVYEGGHFGSDTRRICAAAPEDGIQVWKDLANYETSEAQIQAFFVENMSGLVLQILGRKFNIEPFFYSSSLNWIPSRYQEVEANVDDGDHITITLTFLKLAKETSSLKQASFFGSIADSVDSLTNQMINTQAPLLMNSSRRKLVLDFLSVHLVRRVDKSTIISYHPDIADLPTTEAKYLHDRIKYAGQSVYWQNIFQKSSDPTFVLLTFIWHAMYAWDESLEALYKHICCLETEVLDTSDMRLTQELHIIRAHHLHYSSLLEDFRKTVQFVATTPNPAMKLASEEVRQLSENMMRKECNTLLNEIARLEMGRRVQEKRLKNVMNLVFSNVNIKDSAAMKQIAYLTMIFLPASFAAAIFGMNIQEISPDTKGTLLHYLIVALPLTVVTILGAFHSKRVTTDGILIGLSRMVSPLLNKFRNQKTDKASGDIA